MKCENSLIQYVYSCLVKIKTSKGSFLINVIYLIVAHWLQQQQKMPMLFHLSSLSEHGASLVTWTVKRLPAMRETQVQSLGQEDPLEKEMATHSSTLAWRIPWTKEPGGLQSMGLQRFGHDWATSLYFTSEHSEGPKKNQWTQLSDC